MIRKIYKVSKEQAIRIAADHNCVPLDIAKNYTDTNCARSCVI